MRLEKYYRMQALNTSTEHVPGGAHAHAVAIKVLDDVELVHEPTDEAIKRAFAEGNTAILIVVCGGQAVPIQFNKAQPLEGLFTQLRVLLG